MDCDRIASFRGSASLVAAAMTLVVVKRSINLALGELTYLLGRPERLGRAWLPIQSERSFICGSETLFFFGDTPSHEMLYELIAVVRHPHYSHLYLLYC
jgi:hypothetical protein